MLEVWINLKLDQPDAAWEALVAAQEEIGCGMRLRPNASFREVPELLRDMERLLFPAQVFVSSAIKYESAECSACGSVYGECDHLAGELNMGEMCVAVVRNVLGIDHVAIVKQPDNKRCRCPTWPDGDVQRCCFTHRVVAQADRGLE